MKSILIIALLSAGILYSCLRVVDIFCGDEEDE